MMSTVPASAIAATPEATTAKHHHLAAHHAAKATTHVQTDSTHHLVHLSATVHGSAQVAAKAGAGKLADYVLRYPWAKASSSGKKASTPVKKLDNYAPIAGAFAPAQVEGAYGVTALGTAHQGQGTTIAIIDEFNDPNILADTNTFSNQYGLPRFNSGSGTPTLSVVNDTTFGTVSNAPIDSTATETSLDVQWAHAMAPQANILLVQVPASGTNNTEFQELLEGVQYAAKQPGVDVISLSYGYPEAYLKGTPSIISLNSTYLSNGPASLLPVTVSTGDYALPLFPAMTDNVIGVGGTSLYTSNNSTGNAYQSETSWGGAVFDDFGDEFSKGSGGGGLSATFGSPTFQSANGVNYPNRSIPDLAAIADPYTGVSIYDSYDAQGGDPWNQVGGTSLAAPVVAGMIDLAQQNRIAAGKSLLNSVQINTLDYAAYSNATLYPTVFHDITQGTNEDYQSGYPYYTSSTGYDLTTGVGSPRANTFVPYLTSAS